MYKKTRQVMADPVRLTGGFSGDHILRLPVSVLRLYQTPRDAQFVCLLRELGDAGVSPRIYHHFGAGHIEEFVNGRPLTLPDSQELFLQVARQMSRLHRVPTARVPSASRRDIWTEMQACVEKLRANLSAQIDPEEARAELGFVRALLDPVLQRKEEWTLCHNDLFRGNILRCDNEVRFIDFEMASVFHPWFDVANFFCECCMDMECDAYDEARFPSAEQQRDFFGAYAGEGSVVVPDLKIIHGFVLLSHLYWALADVSKPGYDMMRMRQYRAAKRALTEK